MDIGKNETDNDCELISVKKLAVMLELSERSLWRMNDSGKLPSPLHIGNRSVRWRVKDIKKWISEGCT